MSQSWVVTMKPSFQTEWRALPAKEVKQVLEKIDLLSQDPTPDAKVKKKLKYQHADLYRIRCGSYRVFYTFKEGAVSLLALRRRDESTYSEDIEAEFLKGYVPEFEATRAEQPDWERIFAPQEQKTPLPEGITVDLLARLQVPPACHARLEGIGSREELLECPGIPDEILLRLDDYLFERPLVEVLEQPDYIAQQVSDLIRFKEGDLLGFLLKLDPEQEKLVEWGLDASGPELVRGGPGTGKSMIALYRARAFLRALPKQPTPRILFTTYTNALVAFSRQLLDQLLGEESHHVEVRTADSLAFRIIGPELGRLRIATSDDVRRTLAEAVASAQFSGNSLEKRDQQKSVGRLSLEYLADEIAWVIDGGGLNSLDEYIASQRPGRGVAMDSAVRRSVWAVRERFHQLLDEAGKVTWEQLRARAARLAASPPHSGSFDAVIVDEVQDLNRVSVHMLASLCKSPNRLFLTADANQAIYGSSFRWGDIRQLLGFETQVATLGANYRNTQEIDRAARDYLGSAGTLDDSKHATRYAHSGPLPAVRQVDRHETELELLVSFIRGAARELHLSLGSCAVLTPYERRGRQLAGQLLERGIQAEFMTGQNLDLKKPLVKVITLKSAKGLEFPIVALAGFCGQSYPLAPRNAPKEAIAEALAQERRTLFVAMTRAMRALLVLPPRGAEGPLFEGFDPILWNVGG